MLKIVACGLLASQSCLASRRRRLPTTRSSSWIQRDRARRLHRSGHRFITPEGNYEARQYYIDSLKGQLEDMSYDKQFKELYRMLEEGHAIPEELIPSGSGARGEALRRAIGQQTLDEIRRMRGDEAMCDCDEKSGGEDSESGSSGTPFELGGTRDSPTPIPSLPPSESGGTAVLEPRGIIGQNKANRKSPTMFTDRAPTGSPVTAPEPTPRKSHSESKHTGSTSKQSSRASVRLPTGPSAPAAAPTPRVQTCSGPDNRNTQQESVIPPPPKPQAKEVKKSKKKKSKRKKSKGKKKKIFTCANQIM